MFPRHATSLFAAVFAAQISFAAEPNPSGTDPSPQPPAAATPTELDRTVVVGTPYSSPFLDSISVPATGGTASAHGNAIGLFADQPAFNLQSGGGLSGVPGVHGLADDRVGVQVDGVTTPPACPNHMNPPLAQVDPARVVTATLFSGLSPVSIGGDNLGPSIIVESRQPIFAGPQESLHSDAQASSYARSFATYGGSVFVSAASKEAAIAYSSAWNRASNYSDGDGNRVTSTYYRNADHSLIAAFRNADQLLTVQGTLHRTPAEGFANQQMDLTRDRGQGINVHYEGKFNWGSLDGRGYWQSVRHEMNIGQDKSLFPMPMFMPMDTYARNIGYSLVSTLALTETQALKAGAEYHRYGLDDRWPAVPGTDPYMAPDEFVNLNHGRRDRVAFFTELESRWSPTLVSSIGVRVESVHTSAGAVHGYSDMYAGDAAAFNQRSRSRTDTNVDLSWLLQAKPSQTFSIEGGYVRKNRSPSLYERYAWSSDLMISGMVNWFGDGNYYVGRTDLAPETANTASVTASWHDAASKSWEVRLTPYYTYVQDYIDVDLLKPVNYGESSFSQLRFANHDASIVGTDLAASATLWDASGWGTGKISGSLGWTQSRRRDTGKSLYHTPPLSARVALSESFATHWRVSLEGQAVGKKNRIDELRREPVTPGYALLNTRISWQWEHILVEAGVENLFDRNYALPLGGVNFDDYMASGWSARISPLHGPGRTFFGSVTWTL